MTKIDKRDILSTSIRNVEELKRRYNLEKENEIDLSNYLSSDILPLEVGEGGTGGTNRSEAFTNLSFIGTNPSISDNPANWRDLGSGYAFINQSYLSDQPASAGILINFVQMPYITQEFISLPSGGHYYRSGTHFQGWTHTWKRFCDSGDNLAKKPTLLWSNESPTSNFAAQTVELDLSGYSHVLIENSVTSGSSNTYIRRTELFQKGFTATMFNASHFTWMCSRRATVSDTGIVFTTGKYGYVGESGQGDGTQYCIPTKIYGVNF